VEHPKIPSRKPGAGSGLSSANFTTSAHDQCMNGDTRTQERTHARTCSERTDTRRRRDLSMWTFSRSWDDPAGAKTPTGREIARAVIRERREVARARARAFRGASLTGRLARCREEQRKGKIRELRACSDRTHRRRTSWSSSSSTSRKADDVDPGEVIATCHDDASAVSRRALVALARVDDDWCTYHEKFENTNIRRVWPRGCRTLRRDDDDGMPYRGDVAGTGRERRPTDGNAAALPRFGPERRTTRVTWY